MRLIVHDYSGHPFQIQLSRELAQRGHEVAHWYCASYATGHGALSLRSGDATSLSIDGLSMGAEFARYSPARRVWQELRYGRQLAARLESARPDVVVFCNVPLLAHATAARDCARRDIPMVFWHQDIYSYAIGAAARAKLGRFVGAPIASVAERLERNVARRSRAIVPVSDAFLPVLSRWGVADRATVIPNWGPVEEIAPLPKDNDWSRRHGLHNCRVFLYSGTLGLKHNPAILWQLASRLESADPAARVVVASQGSGRDWLEEQRQARPLSNLMLLDYQPYEDLGQMMASADVLVALLEPEASRYSVPSKVLTYLCAGRAVLAVLPESNAAAVTVRESRAGVVSDPLDSEAVVDAAMRLLADDAEREEMGRAARIYAESVFSVKAIADEFEDILSRAAGGPRRRPPLRIPSPRSAPSQPPVAAAAAERQ